MLFHKIRGLLGLSAFLFLLGGCAPKQVSDTTTVSITPAPSVTTAPGASDFAAFLNETFRDYAASDSLSLHYTIVNPEALGITAPTVSLGNFSSADLQAASTSATEKLAALHTYSKDTLSESEQFLYELLEYALENSVLPEGCELYDTPLGPATGLQTQLPVLLAEYRFSSRSDVEDYFLLLEDLPNYFADICTFERERSAAGTQSCAEVLNRIILQCKAFIENPGDNFLIAGFTDRLAVLPELSPTEIAELSMRNQTLVFTKVIPAYELLIETLTELCDDTVSARGLSTYPKGIAYYEYLVKSNTGTDKSLEELDAWLEENLRENMVTMATLYQTEGFADELEVYLEKGLSSLSSTTSTFGEVSEKKEVLSLSETLLADLQNHLLTDFPAPAEASCRVLTIHPSLEDFISPALYLVPPLDGYTENVIYINQAKCSLEGMFSTLAHEGYPGHLYQNTYFAATNPHPLRMLLNFTGYDEGWATYAECYAYRYADCSEELRDFLVAEQIAGLCLYSLSDMRIHYRGDSREEIISFLQEYGFSAESAEEVYYAQLAEPAIYLPYTVGYLEFCDLRDCYFALKGEGSSLLPFHTFLLETGPAPFGMLKSKLMDEFQ
ncbi:MAG: DUF885 domain-containing protein [Lachnospiraceae bacterium]|nr:DUF885 domain-containing protein [Lachnospiraceae bacterium]